MRVTVHLGEPFWRAAGQREMVVTLTSAASVAQALAMLAKRYPALAHDMLNGEVRPAVFVNDEEARLDSALTEGATVHVVWPVSGG